jgi:hypothetical protein
VAKLKLSKSALDTEREPVFTPRFAVALVLAALGIAWVVYYYVGVRPDQAGGDYTGLAFMQKLKGWNYFIGFALFFVGLIVAAHPKTPLGRGRGVVVGMLGCFLLGLAWIVVFYVFSNAQLEHIWIFNDLGQKNLLVGIAFMAVGFAFATRWE